MKRLYEGASVLSAILFVVAVGVGFFFKTKGFKDEIKHKKHHEKRMEKAEKKHQEERARAKEAAQKERAEIMRQAKAQIDEEKRKIDDCHEEDHARIEGWEAYYENLCEYRKDQRNFDRGNEIYVPPPSLNYEPKHQPQRKEDPN